MSKARTTFPEKGMSWEVIEPLMTQMAGGDEQWRDGRVPLYVFKATDEAYEITRDAYQFFAENAPVEAPSTVLAEWNSKSSRWH